MAKSEDGGGSSGGWISKFGLPTLILSLVTFLFQMQQNAFDRSQRMLETGYQFYSAGRTNLEKHSDVEKESTLLMVIGQAFPNIFCKVRENMIQRAISARSNVEGVGFDKADSENLVQLLRDNKGPESWPVPSNLGETLVDMWPKGRTQRPPVCAEEQKPPPAPAKAGPADEAAPSVTVAVTPQAAAPAPAAKDAAPATAEQAIAGAAAPTQAAQASTDVKMAAAPSVIRVFFQIPRLSQRDISGIDAARDELAPLNYRVVRGIERVPAIRAAEVRYYGPDAATLGASAEQLAKYLTAKFGVPFAPRWLGREYPNNPADNMEVWLPDPAGARPALGGRLREGATPAP